MGPQKPFLTQSECPRSREFRRIREQDFGSDIAHGKNEENQPHTMRGMLRGGRSDSNEGDGGGTVIGRKAAHSLSGDRRLQSL